MLKFSLKQQWLNFTEGWAVTEDELKYHADDNEDSSNLLGKLSSEIREDGVDIDSVLKSSLFRFFPQNEATGNRNRSRPIQILRDHNRTLKDRS